MKILTILIIFGVTLQSGRAQEPFTYKPEYLKKENLPKGVTAEEYIKKIYEDRHYKIKVTFRAIGEDGGPIPNADINVGIDSILHSDGYNNYKGKTDANGLFTVESRGRGCNDVVLEKNGYYPSRPKVEWDGELNPGGKVMHQNGGYRPWNPTIDVVLKKIGKPIPMMVRLGGRCRNSIGSTTSQLGKNVGWDLVEGDWIAPRGKGKVADLVLKFEASFTDESKYDSSVTVSFGNPDDGLIAISELNGEESRLKYPRTAPEEGYSLRKLEFSRKLENGVLSVSPEKHPKAYFIRLRTKKNAKGEITSAIYGKVTRPFEFIDSTFRKKYHTFLKYDYYLNLTPNDRNLEYDQKNNLAPEADKDLSWPP